MGLEKLAAAMQTLAEAQRNKDKLVQQAVENGGGYSGMFYWEDTQIAEAAEDLAQVFNDAVDERVAYLLKEKYGLEPKDGS